MVNRPYGGLLVNRVVSERDVSDLPSLSIGFDEFLELRNIAEGVFSPLKGFMTSSDFDSVVERHQLSSGLSWTIPVVLDVTRVKADDFVVGDDVALVYGGKPVGVLHLSDKYSFDRRAWCDSVFGVHDSNHPGVRRVFSHGDVLLGGPVEFFNNVGGDDFRLSPRESRELIRQNGWRSVAAFQTRNAPHRAHEYLQKTALEVVDGLLVHPLVGHKKVGDFRNEVIVGAYDVLIKNYYPSNSMLFGILTTMMHYAGPMEAVHHAIMRRNHGCSHFIVGRDHAGVGDFYEPFAAQRVFDNFPDLGIEPLFFDNAFFCSKCGTICTAKTCPHPNEFREVFSGTRIRKMLLNGSGVPQSMMRPEVYDYLKKIKELYVN